MKIVSSSELPALPQRALDLISSGIYSLFELKKPRAGYLLITDNGSRYFLDKRGSVLLKGQKIENLRDAVSHAVRVSDAEGKYALINN
jgi:hypothetical protein